ncbi:MAG: hypothetical protein ACYDDA_15170 [Acidiferrobacteraceae bacterium]
MTKNDIQSTLEKVGFPADRGIQFIKAVEDGDGQLVAAEVTVYYATARPDTVEPQLAARGAAAGSETVPEEEENEEVAEELAEELVVLLSLDYRRGGFDAHSERWEWRGEALLRDHRWNLESITKSRGDDPHYPDLIEAIGNAIADADGLPYAGYEFTQVAVPDALRRLHATVE